MSVSHVVSGGVFSHLDLRLCLRLRLLPLATVVEGPPGNEMLSPPAPATAGRRGNHSTIARRFGVVTDIRCCKQTDNQIYILRFLKKSRDALTSFF